MFGTRATIRIRALSLTHRIDNAPRQGNLLSVSRDLTFAQHFPQAAPSSNQAFYSLANLIPRANARVNSSLRIAPRRSRRHGRVRTEGEGGKGGVKRNRAEGNMEVYIAESAISQPRSRLLFAPCGIIRTSAKLVEGRRGAGIVAAVRGSRVDRPFIYITYRRNVANREIDITAVPARDVARCPLYRAFAYKHTPTNNTALHSNVLTPRGLNRRDTPTSPDSPYLHLPMCPAVCSLPRGKPGGKRKRRNAARCASASARRHFSGSYRPFRNFRCIYIYIYALLLRARAVSKDVYCQ